MTMRTKILGVAAVWAVSLAVHLGAPPAARAGKMCYNATTGKYTYTTAAYCIPSPPLLNADGTAATLSVMRLKPPEEMAGGWFEGPIDPTTGEIVILEDAAFDIDTGDVFRLNEPYAEDLDFAAMLLGYGFSPWIDENDPTMNPLGQASNTTADGFLTDVIFSASDIVEPVYNQFAGLSAVSFYGIDPASVINLTTWFNIVGALGGTSNSSDPIAPLTASALSADGITAIGELRPAFQIQTTAYAGMTRYFNANFVWDPRVQPVPEPSAVLLLGSGLIGLAAVGRRRRKGGGRGRG